MHADAPTAETEGCASFPTRPMTRVVGDGAVGNLAIVSPANRRPPVNPETVDYYKLALRSLRGRYLLVGFTGLLAMGLGGMFGWRMGSRQYRSEGLVKIAYVVPPVMRETDQNRPLAMYEAFMRSQQMVLGSSRLVQAALRDTEWQATGRGDSPQVIDDFARHLTVERPPGSELLRVAYTDASPEVTAAAVRSIITSYVKTYSTEDEQFQEQRIKVLDDRIKAFREQLDTLGSRMRAAIKTAGAENLDQLYEAAARRLASLDARLSDVRLALALARATQHTESGQTADVSRAADALSVRQIAMTDPLMRQYLAEQARLEAAIERLTLRGIGPKNPDLVLAKIELGKATSQVEQYAAGVRELRVAMARNPNTTATSTVPIGQSVESLQADEAVIGRLHDAAKQELGAISVQRQQMGLMKAEADRITKELAQTTERKETLLMESVSGGRLEVITRGEVPITPYVDNRLKFGGAGAVAGACLPLALIVCAGLVNRRYRFVDDASEDMSRQEQIPLLGVLPILPRRLTDPEQAASAAFCVHQIRVLLQMGRPAGPQIFLVTSAAPSEGKTSLTAALGYSFAASGARTLLIDCDLVGRGLTRGFGETRTPGLHEAIMAGSLATGVCRLANGLCLLPAGLAHAADACSISGKSLRPLLAEARQSFDIVLIDTGPLLGSVEAAVLAPEVDSVILTVARGQSPRLVERTLSQLRAAGAAVAGFVFNRATHRDFAGSCSSSSLRSVSPDEAGMPVLPANFAKPTEFGPIVESVASFQPAMAAGGR